MRYSEYPHEHYLVNGQGPGSIYLGDLEMWNWRWLMRGTVLDTHFDLALPATFNVAQRGLMRKPPAEALRVMLEVFPAAVTEQIQARAEEAQQRLFGPLVMRREGNLTQVNFGRHR